VLLRPPFENWYLRKWGLRKVWGPLQLPDAVFQTFMAAPYDLTPDFVQPPQWRRREHDHPRYARFCYALARGTGARRILEVGSSSGGTTTGWARALADAAGEGADVGLVCVDDDSYNPGVYPAITGQNVAGAGLALDRVTFYCGDSRVVLPGLQAEHPRYFDIYLVDAGHTFELALGDLENGLPMVRRGGFIAVHDVDRARPMPESTPAHPAPVYEAVEHFARTHQFESCIVGFVRKHLAIIQVRG
jgi:predicted O-methyltransferase YrrM